MQQDKFTIKSQEAVQAAQRLGGRAPQPADDARAPACCAARAGRWRRRSGAAQARRRPRGGSPGSGPGARGAADTERRHPGRAGRRLERARPDPPRGRERNARAQGRVRLDRAPDAVDLRARGKGGRSAEGRRRQTRGAAEGACRSPRQPSRDRSEPGGQVPGARALRSRPDRGRARRASSTR